jgi:hypothetical protein
MLSRGSLASYKSRLNSSIVDFLRYKENPARYRLKGQRAARTKINDGEKSRSSDQSSSEPTNEKTQEESQGRYPDTVELSTFPIPLRQGLTAKYVESLGQIDRRTRIALCG